MFNHLLVPLDGSELAEAVLPMVLAIAERFESEITLLRVVHPPHFASTGHNFAELYVSMSQDMHHEATAYTEAKQRELVTAGFKINTRVVEGEFVADTILDVADELGIEAIAMSTHGRGGIRRWVFGSVADKVLQHATVPILLVRAQPEEVIQPVNLPSIESVEDIRAHNNLKDLSRMDR
jgi:nucleotide-binding universal stress UspA family protein